MLCIIGVSAIARDGGRAKERELGFGIDHILEVGRFDQERPDQFTFVEVMAHQYPLTTAQVADFGAGTKVRKRIIFSYRPVAVSGVLCIVAEIRLSKYP